MAAFTLSKRAWPYLAVPLLCLAFAQAGRAVEPRAAWEAERPAPMLLAGMIQARPAKVPLSIEATQEAQDRIRPMLYELEQMREDPDFHRHGFSRSYPPGSDWWKRLQALRREVLDSRGIAPIVRGGPGALISLAKEWQKSGGRMTDMAGWNMQAVQAALAWQP